jgi:hypothetical protein
MTRGLPKAETTVRPKSAFHAVMIGGVENLTRSLRRGDAFDDRSLADMTDLRQRLRAFESALDMRLRAAGLSHLATFDVIDGDEDEA